MNGAKTIRAPIGDGSLHVEVRGSGHPVLFVGGLGSDASFWEHQVELHPSLRSVTFDQRGMSRSDPSNAPTTVAAFASEAVAVLDALSIETAHVVGHSMGGAIAQEIALSHADRLDRLVLACTFPRGPRAGRMRSALWPAILECIGPEAYIDNVLAWCLASQTFEQRWDWVQGLRAGHQQRLETYPIDPGVLRGQCEAIRSFDRIDDLPRIAGPTLVIVGHDDILTPPVWSERLAGAIPGARLHIVAGAGHLLPKERPETFNRIVADFLDPTTDL